MKNIFLEKSEKQFNQLGIPRFKKYISLFRMGGGGEQKALPLPVFLL